MERFLLSIAFGVLLPGAVNTAAYIIRAPEVNSGSSHDESFRVHNSSRVSDGACVCRVEVPSTIHCTSGEVDTLEDQVSQLSTRLDQHIAIVQAQDTKIVSLTEAMTSALDKLEEIEGGIISRPEFDLISREIEDLEKMLLMLRENSTVNNKVVTILEAEFDNLTTVLRTLVDPEETNTEQLMAEVSDLKRRLVECKRHDDEQQMAILFSYDWNRPGLADSCHKLTNVSAPFTVRSWDNMQGTWFRDPIKDRNKVYVFPMSSSYYGNYVSVYTSMKAFRLNQGAERIQLTENAQGTGMVAYNGSLYYAVYRSADIARYDIARQRQKKTSLPSGTKLNNQGAYLSSSYSDIDFAVDETGVWVIYTTTSANGVIVISKLDPDSLLRTETWTTSVTKSSQGNCFVTCQVLHCTNSYNTHADKINYFFDTKTSVESFIYVPIDSKFLATYSLSYNPYDQKLYGWDKGHQVIYQLSFEE